MTRRKPAPKRAKPWQPLRPAEVGDPARFTEHGLSIPEASYVNDLYSVYVRHIGHGALHISFHRHTRAPIRDWRHFQAIKNEVAGPERLAVEVFPPESRLVDSANEYHLWVVPVGWEEHFPFCMQATLVATQDDMEATYGRTKARQRDWQPDIPTGLGCSPGEQP